MFTRVGLGQGVYWALAIAGAMAVPSAGQVLPNIGAETSVGRIRVFMTPKETVFFLPIALSAQAQCFGADAKKSCFVRVFNALRIDEVAGLDALAHNSNKTVSFFSDTDQSIVEAITESFSGLPPSLAGAKMLLLKTLRLGDITSPYASVAKRISSEEAQALLTQFDHEGIGEFESSVKFRAERVGAYLALTDSTSLRSSLLETRGKSVTADKLRQLIARAADGHKVIFGMTDSIADGLLELSVRRRFVSLLADGSYSVRLDVTTSMESPLIVFDETLSSLVVTCSGRLPLKRDATAVLACAVSSQ